MPQVVSDEAQGKNVAKAPGEQSYIAVDKDQCNLQIRRKCGPSGVRPVSAVQALSVIRWRSLSALISMLSMHLLYINYID
jgi:hypothetical protein